MGRRERCVEPLDVDVLVVESGVSVTGRMRLVVTVRHGGVMPVLRMRSVLVLLRQPCQPEQAANGDARVQSPHRAASHYRGLLAVGGLQSIRGARRSNGLPLAAEPDRKVRFTPRVAR